MVRLISEQKSTEGEVKLRMNPIGRLFSNTNYFINMTVCTDPKCDCGGASIQIVREENLGTPDIEYILPIDVHEEEIHSPDHKSFYIKEGNPHHIPELLADGLTWKDWRSLQDAYQSRKFKAIERVNPDDIHFEFSEEQHEDIRLMFPYYEVFPCSTFSVELDGKEYGVADCYCKNPGCTCNNLLLNVIVWTFNEDGDYSSKPLGSYRYDYKVKAGKVSKGNRTTVLSVVEQLLNQHDGIHELFARRHQISKKLYTKDRHIRDEARNLKQNKRISRNQLCPCGSGKKYKRCCLKKDEARR